MFLNYEKTLESKRERKSWLQTQHSKNEDECHSVPSPHGKQIGKQWNQWQTFFSWLQNHCLWWLQPWHLLASWKKNYDKPRQHIKSRDITLPTEVHLVKAMVFPVIMYGCESWTIKKAECQRIDAFELRCWRRLLRVHWTERISNQSILKEMSPEYSLEGDRKSVV